MNLVIFGAFWGDEGKGKITNYLINKLNFNCVIRYNGGPNAGHIVVTNGKKYKFNLLPSGIMNQNVTNILDGGVVINLEKLSKEIINFKKNNIWFNNLIISNRASIIFPFYITLDEIKEKEKKADKIGTTKNGIGHAYGYKFLRSGIRIGELFNKEFFRKRLKTLINDVNIIFKHYNQKIIDFDTIFNSSLKYFNEIKKYICDSKKVINSVLNKNQKIIFEGAQGALLGIEHGNFPYVSSSSSLPNAIPLYSGIPASKIHNQVAVVKAYCTKVGGGFFPTEFNNEISEKIREIGHEYGTNTKLPRRIGWLDVVKIRQLKVISDINYLAITLIDVLSFLDEIKICTYYKYNDKIITTFPSDNYWEYIQYKANYIKVKGWKSDITKCRKFADLPILCKNFIGKIEELTKCKVIIISVGPERNATIIKHPEIIKKW